MTLKESQKEVQISFRTTPEIKRLARIEAAKEDKTLNEWIKQLVEKNLSKASSQNSELS